MSEKTLQFKISLLGLAVLGAVVSLAWIGHRSVNELMALAQLDVVNRLTHSSMDLDMMHDAIQNDVLMGVKALEGSNSNVLLNAKDALTQHIGRAEKNLEIIAALQLSDAMRGQAKEAASEFRSYNERALEVFEKIDEAMLRPDAEKNNIKQYEERFFNSFKALEETMENFGQGIAQWSQRIKEEGMNNAESAKQKLLIVLVGAIFLALLTPFYIALKLFKPMKDLLKHCDALSKGEYESAIPHQSRSDEIGKLAHSLEVLREKASDAFRLRQVLEDLPISVMTADIHQDFKVNYANKQSFTMLRNLQQHLSINVENLVGTSIDIFHKHPAKIRELLQNPENLPHRAKVMVGDEVMQLQVSGIFDKNGKYLSPVLAWDMITGKEALANSFENTVGAVVNTLVDAAGDLEERAVTLQGAIEELSITAADISSRASDSLKIVKDSNDKGEEARSFMVQLSGAAEQITSVVTLISNIADKTNLLALNATIESARVWQCDDLCNAVKGSEPAFERRMH